MASLELSFATFADPALFDRVELAVGETGILLHPPLPLAGASMWMEKERQLNESLADG